MSRRSSHPVLWSLAVSSCLLTAGCPNVAPLPTDPQERKPALGTVTVSTPIFTPLTVRDGTKRLDFKGLRDEEELAKGAQRPSAASSRLEVDLLRTALALNVAGPQVSTSDVFRREVANDGTGPTTQQTRTTERTVTTGTPDVPAAAPTATTPDALREKLAAMLGQFTPSKFQLPPDQIATLVAAYKTYMVNLEEFYNVEAFDRLLRNEDEPENYRWIPYKVHFTVTADPGWYVQHQPYDAVAEVTFRLPGDAAGENFRVLTVMPPQAAQTLEELAASVRGLQQALDVGGSAGPVAARAAVERINEVANRVEGVGTNTSLIVGHPSPDTVRIRFRPSVVARPGARDLQPTNRLLTALVLVRQNASDKSPLDAVPDARPPVPSPSTTSPSAPNVPAPNAPAPGAPAATRPTTQSVKASGELVTKQVFRTLAPVPKIAYTKPTWQRAYEGASAACTVEVRSHFAPAIRVRGAELRPPTGRVNLHVDFDRDEPAPPAGGPNHVVVYTDVTVPRYPELPDQPMRFAEATGFYWKGVNGPEALVAYRVAATVDDGVVTVQAIGGAPPPDDRPGGQPAATRPGPAAGVVRVRLGAEPPAGAVARVMLVATAVNGTTERVVTREVELVPQSVAAPSLGRDASGLWLLPPAPFRELTADQIRALSGDRKDVQIHVIPVPLGGGGNPPNPAAGGAAAPGTRPAGG